MMTCQQHDHPLLTERERGGGEDMISASTYNLIIAAINVIYTHTHMHTHISA